MPRDHLPEKMLTEPCKVKYILLYNQQVEGLQRHPKYGARIEKSTYKGMYHALKEILIREGFTGLYKGIIPSLIKSAPAGAVTFLAYEHISDFLELIMT